MCYKNFLKHPLDFSSKISYNTRCRDTKAHTKRKRRQAKGRAMIAIQNDTCYSTALNGYNPFNTDGVPRTTLDPDFARTALDFTIIKRQSYDEEGRRIPRHYHLVKSNDNAFIPSAAIGEQFLPIQHIDVYDYIVKEIMPKVPQMELEMVGTIHGGGIGLVAAKFGDTFAVRGDESENNMRLFFINPSNGTGRMVMGFTTVRVICQNTLLAATHEAGMDGFKVSHTKISETKTWEAVKSIERQAVAAIEMKERCRRLGEIGVDSGTIKRCLNMIYPLYNMQEGSPAYLRMMDLRDKIIAEFEAGETAQTIKTDSAWKLLNSFTFPIFHPDRVSKRTDEAEIAYQGMTGTVAQKTRKVLLAVESAVAA